MDRPAGRQPTGVGRQPDSGLRIRGVSRLPPGVEAGVKRQEKASKRQAPKRNRRLRRGKSNVELLKAAFPGGSITGAPKVRAMEIIDELEPTKRSVYTGSIGYLSFNEDMDVNIVIRTFLIKEGKAYFQVGGGIIYDSDPEAEYMETLDKAKALIQALQLAPKVVVATK